MRLKIYKVTTSILLKFLILKWDIWRTIWRIEVSDGSFFLFFALFHLSFTFFRPEFPFKQVLARPQKGTQLKRGVRSECLSFSRFVGTCAKSLALPVEVVPFMGCLLWRSFIVSSFQTYFSRYMKILF